MRSIAVLRALVLALAIVAGPAFAGAKLVSLPVPLVTIYPGEILDAGRLGEHTFVQSKIGSGYAETAGMLVGMVARRTLLPGHPVPVSALDQIELVSRGAHVRIVFEQPGLTIVAYASPLEDGSAGDVIRLRNVDSGTVVTGIVQPDGSVRVGTP